MTKYINELELEIKKLKEENNKLSEELTKSLAVIKELKDEIAKLKKNSMTSSKPPSSDIVKQPHERRQKGIEKKLVFSRHTFLTLFIKNLLRAVNSFEHHVVL